MPPGLHTKPLPAVHAGVENYWRYSRLNQSSAIKSATSSRNACRVVWGWGLKPPATRLDILLKVLFGPKDRAFKAKNDPFIIFFLYYINKLPCSDPVRSVIYHQTDEAIRGHVFCSFLALLLRKELSARLEKAELDLEWADVKQDLAALHDITIDENGKRLTIRSECLGCCGKVFKAVGVAAPPTIRENV